MATGTGMLSFAVIDALAPNIASVPPFFGLYEHGQLLPLFVNRGVLRFSASGTSAVSSAPLADGIVQTYNKVRTPRTIEIALTMDGGTVRRLSFLSQLYYIDDYQPTMTFDLITPSAYFQNYAMVSHFWELNDDRQQNVIVLNLTFQQILQPTDLALLSVTSGLSPETWLIANMGRVVAQAATAAAVTYATKSLSSVQNATISTTVTS